MKRKMLLNGVIYAFIVILLFQLSGCQRSYPPAKDITLVPLFTDNMVLQQKQDIPIWGKAEPGGEVLVTLNKQEKKGIVDDEGNWKVSLAPVPAGGPYELVISGEKTHRIKNVMVGEVWVCSGQSNMEMPLAGWGIINNYKKEIANANYPNIRLLVVEKKAANTPQEKFNSDGWKECSSESIPEFSAVAYFFGRYLHGELNVPIGLIETAWGGTVAEAWTSGPALKKFPEFKDIVEKIAADKSTDEEREIATKKMIAAWPDKIEEILVNSGTFNHGFQKADYNTDKWKTMKLPTTWEETGLDYDGVVWFSKEVKVPKSWEGKDLVLTLGKINDYDITWFNGKRVGRGTDVADFRVYKIPGNIVKAGENKITVQVLDIGNHGGLYGPANRMKLSTKDKSISLVGNWKYKVDPIKIDINKLPVKPSLNFSPNRPSVLYNGMINPLLPYGIRGAIWYQGESNAGRALQYRSLFKSLINDWRKAWGEGDFPFLFVQLANFMKRYDEPVDESWSYLREAQTMALQLPNTGMAVTIDIGNAIDIHPKNKQDVGKRLALIALAKVYGKNIPYSGPMYKSMKIEGDKIILQFDNTNKGLKTKGDKKLKGFAIGGKDKKFVWAKAKIEGNEVVVSNSKIK
ncbi:Sialic acid-specific 9-O-acetylesterase, partial [hydrothermal vent metagenome]